MNMDPALGGFEVDLRVSLRSLTQADRERLQAPGHLWSRIEAGVRRADSEQAADAPRAKVIPLRRQRRVVAVAGVVALAACAAVAVPLAVNGRETATLLAAAPLSNGGLATFDTTPEGSARLVESRGHQYLEVSVRNAPERVGEHLELWLIDTAVKGMVSLGPYTGSHRYAVPDGISAERFPIVDVSIEPGDGVPTHSGVSVVRGMLPVSDRSA